MGKSIIKPNILKTELVDSFLVFLKNKKISDMALAFILSTQVTLIVNSFITCIINPMLNVFFTSKLNTNLEDYKVNFFGIEYKIGLFISNFLKLIFTLYLVFLIYRYLITS
jgi:large-conductance mechanosensitive channel